MDSQISIIDFDISNEETRQRIIELQELQSSVTISTQFETQMQIQQQYRLLQEESFTELFGKNSKFKKRKMPNHFGLAIACLSDITPTITNESLLRNSRKFQIENIQEEENRNMFGGDPIKCICSHIVKPDNMFVIKNMITKRYVICGGDCIEKHKLLTREEVNELKKKKREQKKKKEKEERDRLEREKIKQERERIKQQRERLKREQEKIREENEAKRIELLKQTHRQCRTCKLYNVDKTKPSWSVDCISCYKEKQPKKKCECGNDIANPKHNLCYTCYRNISIIMDDECYGHS